MASADGFRRLDRNRPETLPYAVRRSAEGYEAVFTCGCGRTYGVRMRRAFPPYEVCKRARRQGWQELTQKQWRCPVCEEEARRKRKGDPMSKIEHIKPANPLQSPVAPTAAAARKVFQLLEEHFDDAKGRYASGWSDAAIAKETGLAEQYIRELRKEAFGDIAPPSELVGFKAEIEAIEQMVKDLRARVESALTVACR